MSAIKAKELLEVIYGFCDLAEDIGGMPDGLDMSLRELFKVETHRFFMFLASADGKIVPEERDYMNDLFDMSFSIQDYVKLINQTDTYSIDFENEVPVSMKILAVLDAKLDLFGDATGKRLPNLIPIVLDFYEKAGLEFIACDGDVDEQEVKDLAAYIAKKKVVLQEIIETENVEDIGIIGRKKGI